MTYRARCAGRRRRQNRQLLRIAEKIVRIGERIVKQMSEIAKSADATIKTLGRIGNIEINVEGSGDPRTMDRIVLDPFPTKHADESKVRGHG